MVISVSVVAVALLLGPGPGEVSPPAPTIDGPIEEPIEAPIEGPAPPPEPAPASEPGIEFATQPPETELEPESSAAQPAAVAEEPSWPTPGTAPPDGFGFITTAAILMPSAALVSWMLLRGVDRRQDQVAILVTGGLIELMAIGGLSMGLYRQAKLKRWTLAYRVVARPQGSGLLAAGGIALNFGVALTAAGAVSLNRGDVPFGATTLGLGIAGLAVITPLTLYFGSERRRRYDATGGWYRPPLPTVQLTPRVIVTDTTFGLGVAGQF